MTTQFAYEDERATAIAKMFRHEHWLTARQVPQAPQWEQEKRIYSVDVAGVPHYAAYQFDEHRQPLPVIADILANFGPARDNWTIAAWFHFPNGWLADFAGSAISPRMALSHPHAVLRALANRTGTYVA